MSTSAELLRDRRVEVGLDAIGPFHARWYQPEPLTAGPFHSAEELAEHMRRHGLPRPFELLTLVGV
jgi:hypothetical protein